MTLLKWSAPAALAIALTAAPAMAEETPRATMLDHRVREANYNDRQVYEIPGVFRVATEIVFAKDEVVEHVALGDTVSWEVAPAANSLFIKPREQAGRTNLTVITRSRYGPRILARRQKAGHSRYTGCSPIGARRFPNSAARSCSRKS